MRGGGQMMNASVEVHSISTQMRQLIIGALDGHASDQVAVVVDAEIDEAQLELVLRVWRHVDRGQATRCTR
jgi:hypothetical protein